jgi:hypothetical protein
MTQTTGHVALACGKLEISTNGSSWTDISGSSQGIDQAEQARNVGEAYTLDGDTALVAGGKRQPMDLVVNVVYTETDAEAYQVTRLIFEAAGCGSDFYVRWSPRGGLADHEQITSGKGILSNFKYPNMDASAGGPIMAGFTVRVPSLSTTIVAS